MFVPIPCRKINTPDTMLCPYTCIATSTIRAFPLTQGVLLLGWYFVYKLCGYGYAFRWKYEKSMNQLRLLVVQRVSGI